MAKSESIRIRLDIDEKEAFQRAAHLSGLALSTWIRERLRRSARIELEDAGEKISFIKPRTEES